MKYKFQWLLTAFCIFIASSTQMFAEGSSSEGNVVVENSGKLVIDSDIRTVVWGGLHCKKGGKLFIK